ncbi:hypothetical protein LJC59_01260 [Desulfovibrio sp. OttesenSCG-928-A18]|nr:hypothetical protein [Desulfovibrio sp. OttesenSCG-928-A18]
MWSLAIKALRGLWDGVSFAAPYFAPAFLGALAGARKKDRRKMGFCGWAIAIFWSTVAGAGLAPLATHFIGAPEGLGQSVAFLIALVGYDKTNAIRSLYRVRKEVKDGGENGQA